MRSLPASIILLLSRRGASWNSYILVSQLKGGKNPNKPHRKTIKTTPIKKPTTHSLLNYFLCKDRGSSRCVYPQNRMKCPFPVKGPFPSCCQTFRMRNKHRRVLYVIAEDEALNRGFSLTPLTIPRASSVQKGFSLFALDSCFILLF